MSEKDKDNDVIGNIISGCVIVFIGFFFFYKCLSPIKPDNPTQEAFSKAEDKFKKEISDPMGVVATAKTLLNEEIEIVLKKDPILLREIMILPIDSWHIENINKKITNNGITLLIGLTKSINNLQDADTTTYKKFVDEIFDLNPDVNLTDNNNMSPLFWCTISGTTKRFKFKTAVFDPHLYLLIKLINNGAIHNKTGYKPLMICCKNNSYKYAKILVDNNALVNLNVEEVNKLINHTSDINIKNLIKSKTKVL